MSGPRAAGRGRPSVRFLLSLALFVLCAALGTLAGYAGAGSVAEGWFHDRALQVRAHLLPGKPAGREPVAVVGLDLATLRTEGFRGLPRPLMGERFAAVGEIALAAGAKAVGFDVIFSFSPDDYVDPATGERPLRGFDRTLLGFLHRNRDRVIVARSAVAVPHRRVVAALGIAGVKATAARPDADGVIRRHHPSAGGAARDHFVDALVGRWPAERRPEGPYLTLPRAKLQGAVPYMSMGAVLACAGERSGAAALEAFFRDRLVLVGSVLPHEDEHPYADGFLPAAGGEASETCPSAPLPQRRAVPGVLILADFIAAPLTGALARPATGPLVTLVLVAFAAAGAAVALFARPSRYPLVALPVVLALAAPVAFLEAGVAFPAASPLLATLAAFVAMSLGRIVLLMRGERRLKRLFGHYLAPHVIEEMARSGALPDLAGENRHVVVAFVDIVGSSAFAARNGDAATLAMVNRCFEDVCDVLIDSGAYIDKFVGDAVLAVWNAPNPVEGPEARAVAAARRILEELPGMRVRANHPGLSLRIVLHAGEALVGTVGGKGRRSYTVMGNTVNAASRLEEVAKRLRVPLLVSAAVHDRLPEPQDLALVSREALRGIPGEMAVYAPRGHAGAG